MHVRITGASAQVATRPVCLRVCLLIQPTYRHTVHGAENFPLLEFESGCIESNNELSTDNAKGDFSISLSRASCFSPPLPPFRIIFLKRPTEIAFDGLLVRRLHSAETVSAARIKILRSTCACSAQYPLPAPSLMRLILFLTARRINFDASDIFPRRRILSRPTQFCIRRRDGAKEAALAKCVVERVEDHNLCTRKFLAHVLIT